MVNGPIEPKSDYRVGARELRQLFLALVQEDFTEHQALVILGQMMLASKEE